MFPNIPNYNIIKALPSGGWADVYLANYQGEKVALKILKEKHANDSEKVKDFFYEAKIVQKITHENIVKIVNIGPSKGPLYYFSMEYYSAGNLYDYLKEKKILPNKEIKIIAVEICRALNVIHRRSIVHLDVKPSNILFGENNLIVLSDYGISKDVSSISKTDNVRGTPQYMSPEQFGGEVGFTSDLYSLGVVMYLMSTGMLPFDSDDFNQIGLLHNKVEPIPVSSHNPSIQPGLEKIIAKLLQKKPEDRFQSAKETLVELEKINLESSGSTKTVLIIDQVDSGGKSIKKRVFKNFPVTITKYKDHKNNFSILDTFASKEHATIINPEPGKFMLTDHSKNGTIVNGKLVSDASVLLDDTFNELKIGKTILRISYSSESKKIKVKSSVFIWTAAAILIFSGLVFAYFGLSSHKSTFEISRLTGVPDTVLVDDEINFSFQYSQNGDAAPKSLIIAPFGITGEKLESPLQDKMYRYSETALRGENEKFLTFAVRLKGNNGIESNWLEKKILLKKPVYNIRIDHLELPAEVRINQPFNFQFEVSSPYSQSELMMNIVDGTGKTDILPLLPQNKRWVFNQSGNQNLTIQLMLQNGSGSSNQLKKIINVIPDYPPPVLEFTSLLRIVNKTFVTSFVITDSRFSDPNDFTVSLFFRREEDNSATRVPIRPESGVINYKFEQPGIYDIWVEIRSKDGRRGTYGRIKQTI